MAAEGKLANRTATTSTCKRVMRLLPTLISIAIRILECHCPGMRGTMSRSGLQDVGHPIPHGVDGNRHVVDLAMVMTTLLPAEDPHGLMPGAYGVEAFLGERKRDLLIIGAV